MRRALAALVLVLILTAFIPPANGQAGGLFQAGSSQQARTMLAMLSPEEKVGQLFLVTFKGTDVSPGTQISELVTKYHIGGVMLSAANDNFIGPDGALQDVYRINAALQQQAYEAYTEAPIAGEAARPSHYAPLLIGISQEGDLSPNDQLINGVTTLPGLMSIGATWKTDLSRQAGAVLGAELHALGFNLLFGPSLDVLDAVPTVGSGDLGARTFGGDPYWVGLMGQSYIQGLHEGSQGQMAVVAKHFPGRGSSDRPTEEEVPTVRRSLEQLKQIELAPFATVTGGAAQPINTADALLVSHIRYQGFQTNIRATTSPVSFDRNALDLILKLPAFATWRDAGGVMISDDLGSPALRRFYATTGQAFDPRQVARNAFQAGNDLLYVNNFQADGDPDAFTTITRTINLFVAKYREDPTFAERVDASVLRLLTLKYRMYSSFTLESVVPPLSGLDSVGKSQQIGFEIARQAVTLVSPMLPELETVLPRPPGINDRIVFITDTRSARPCSRCGEQVMLAQDALQAAVLRLYGPAAGGQVYASRLTSYTFTDLTNLLNGTATESAPLEQDLRQAAWIVFGQVSVDSTHPESNALRRFLSERPDLFRNKKVIAFAFGAPYYLDATDISKLTAYYALYSKAPAFVDVAARVLFQELIPTGAAPVSIPGSGYNLLNITAPDPAQIIPLMLDTPDILFPAETPVASPIPTPVPVFKVGDSLPLRAGVILDHNQNPVPDGTVVRFLFTVGGDSAAVQQIETTTTNGVARAVYRIQSQGLLEIRVASDLATTSQILRLDISSAGGVITPIAPTVAPTQTPTPTETATPTATPTVTPTVLPPSRPGSVDWVLAMLVVWAGAAAVYLFGQQRYNLRWGFRWSMTTAVGGLIAYLYFAFARLANEDSARAVTTRQMIVLLVAGMLVGWALGVVWKRWLENRARSQPERTITGPK